MVAIRATCSRISRRRRGGGARPHGEVAEPARRPAEVDGYGVERRTEAGVQARARMAYRGMPHPREAQPRAQDSPRFRVVLHGSAGLRQGLQEQEPRGCVRRGGGPADAADPGLVLAASRRLLATLRRSPGPAWAGRHADGSPGAEDLAAYLGLAGEVVAAVAVAHADFFDVLWNAHAVARIRAASRLAAPGVGPRAVAAPMSPAAPDRAVGSAARGTRR